MFSNQGQGDGRNMPEALGQSEAFFEFQEQLSAVAPIERPVLILGERGTGKELAASRIHFLSKRWQKPLVTLNCAALTPGLIGSELFGYEKGAFTGAFARQTGRFEKASGGTLFLDEMGTIPMEVQEKILRVVEYGSFERVGSSTSIDVDVRIVAATNADLPFMAQSGEFKQDLLDRLSFEVIYVPPLRERKDDILFLANHFAARMAFELGRDEVPQISASASSRLNAYSWPGNIRELKNVIERAVYKSCSDEIDKISFDPFGHSYGRGLYKKNENKKGGEKRNGARADRERGKEIKSKQGQDLERLGSDEVGIDPERSDLFIKALGKPFKEAIVDVEFYLLSIALQACQFNQKKAAMRLGLTYDQFRGLKKKHAQRLI
ncbi:MAG: phage shock protein operon transcriptional activator [Desulfobacula sp.]|nr:phage shock protein operon transcriptional activator [Desulfobacula sp.]